MNRRPIARIWRKSRLKDIGERATVGRVCPQYVCAPIQNPGRPSSAKREPACVSFGPAATTDGLHTTNAPGSRSITRPFSSSSSAVKDT